MNFVLPIKKPVAELRKRTEELAGKGSQDIAAPPSPAELDSVRKAVEGQIDDFLRSIGCPDPAAQTDEKGGRHLQLGSANGRVAVIDVQGDLFLRAEAPIMQLPSDGDLLVPLMRELLELNFGLPVSGRIGIGGEWVEAEVMLRLTDVRPDAASWCIENVMRLADNVDDTLIKKYGGTSKKRTEKAK